MSEFIWIYLYVAMSNLNVLLGFMLTIVAIFLFVRYMISADKASYDRLYPDGKKNHEDLKKKHVELKRNKTLVSMVLLFVFLTTFLPSESDIKTIIAGGLIWKGGKATSEISGIEQLPENLVRAMNGFLEGIIDDSGE